MSRARELARLGNPNTVSADSSSNVGFGTQVPSNKASSTTTLSAGIITATAYYGDGQFLDGVASAGLGTAIDDNKDNAANDIYYVNQVLTVAGVATITTPASTQVAYTNYSDIEVADGGELIVDQGEQFVPDVLGIGTGLQNIISQSQGNGIFGTLYVDNIRDAAGRGGPTFPDGATVTGVLTATTGSFSGNVSIGGTLTYEDVTNIDSVGLITARKGINVTAGVSTFAAGIIVSANGAAITGVTTSTSFSGNINADDISSGIVTSARLGSGAASGKYLDGTGVFRTITSGMSEIDMWVQPSNGGSSGDFANDVLFSGDDARVPAGARSTYNFTKVGDGMSESSGIWTFPSTGTWEIFVQVQMAVSNAGAGNLKNWISTNSGGAYTEINRTNYSPSAGNEHPFYNSSIVTVSDASTARFKATIWNSFTHGGLKGGSDQQTYIRFKKLA